MNPSSGRAAELGALIAQVGFVGGYYNSLNSYTGSIATASVTHATGYAQSTARDNKGVRNLC